MVNNFSDYLIFVDESGDHGLSNIDKDYPIFVLNFVVIKKSDYLEKIIPEFVKLKYSYFGHDQVIFHEHDIRKDVGIFALLRSDITIKKRLIEDLTKVIEEINFTFFASIIDKEKLHKRYSNPHNPYEIAMFFCVEKTLDFLLKKGQQDKKIHLIIESRGKKKIEILSWNSEEFVIINLKYQVQKILKKFSLRWFLLIKNQILLGFKLLI